MKRMLARYPGTCCRTGAAIRPGDAIVFLGRGRGSMPCSLPTGGLMWTTLGFRVRFGCDTRPKGFHLVHEACPHVLSEAFQPSRKANPPT